MQFLLEYFGTAIVAISNLNLFNASSTLKIYILYYANFNVFPIFFDLEQIPIISTKPLFFNAGIIQ